MPYIPCYYESTMVSQWPTTAKIVHPPRDQSSRDLAAPCTARLLQVVSSQDPRPRARDASTPARACQQERRHHRRLFPPLCATHASTNLNAGRTTRHSSRKIRSSCESGPGGGRAARLLWIRPFVLPVGPVPAPLQAGRHHRAPPPSRVGDGSPHASERWVYSESPTERILIRLNPIASKWLK